MNSSWMADTGRTHRLGFCWYQTNKGSVLLWDGGTQCSLDKLLGNLFVCAWEISERVVQHRARPGAGVAGAAAAAAGAWRSRAWFCFRCEVMPAMQDGLLTERGEALPVGGHQRGISPAETQGVHWSVTSSNQNVRWNNCQLQTCEELTIMI